MSSPESGKEIDVVARLETALVALEGSFAAFGKSEALSAEEHRRLIKNLEALLEEVRQLADFLAAVDPDVDSARSD